MPNQTAYLPGGNCPFPRVQKTKNKHGKHSVLVPCGECPACLNRRRNQFCAQAVMEHAWTIEKFGGPGYVWMVTLTYSDKFVPWTAPSPVDLKDVFPKIPRWWARQWLRNRFTPNALKRHELRLGAEGFHEWANECKDWRDVHKAECVLDYLERGAGWDPETIQALENGTIEPTLTLKRKDVQNWVKRCRNSIGPLRVFYAGEYGSSDLYEAEDGSTRKGTTRPHFHAILYGYDRTEVLQAVNLWSSYDPVTGKRTSLGRTDPPLNDSQTPLVLDDMEQKNATPEAAGKYAAKYVLKGSTWKGPQPGPLYFREPQFHQGSLAPGLGYDWAKAHILPRLLSGFWEVYHSPQRRQLSPEDRATFAASEMIGRSAVAQIAGQWYPVGRHLRLKLLEWTGIPEEILDRGRVHNLETMSAIADEIHSDPDLHEQWKEALDERKRRQDEAVARRAEREEQKRARRQRHLPLGKPGRETPVPR